MMKGTISIRTKIAALFIFVITSLVLISNTVVYFVINSIMKEKVLEDMMQTSIQSKYIIDGIMNSVDQITTLLYTDDTVIEAINKNEYTTGELNMALNSVNQKLENLPLSPVIPLSNVTLLINNDFYMASMIKPTESFYYGLFNDASMKNEAWYKETIQKNGKLNIFTTCIKGREFFCIARLVKNLITNTGTEGNFRPNIGVVVVSMDVAMIGDLLETAKLTEGNKVIMTNDNTDVLYSTSLTKEKNIKQSNNGEALLVNYVKKLDEAGLYTVKADKKEYYTYLIDLRYGSKLISIVPKMDILNSISIIKKITVTTVFLIAIAGVAITLIITGSILKPIKRLADEMSGIKSTKNIKAFIKPTRRDEVGILYDRYNKMMDRINDLINDVYKSENARREAELKALEYQINPHFIYNTMDSVNMLALEAGMDDIVDIISSFSDIMRYSIKGISGFVTIEEELEQLKHYVNIQIVCYGGFDVIYEINEQILKYHIPKLILQPLVENSIVHGIAKISENGKIFVSGQIADNTIKLSISDNGPGDDLERINKLIDNKSNYSNTGEYGLKNVDQRIKLHFGNTYGLRYVKNENGELTAVVTIPCQQ